MSKMFVTPPDVAQLSDLASQEIEPSSLVEEGLFTAGGVFVLRDGSPYRGYYHLHRDGEYMAGFSHDPNDAASQNTYARAYSGLDVFTIVRTDKDIKTHIYHNLKKVTNDE